MKSSWQAICRLPRAGTPNWIRTSGLPLRRRTLYPAELSGQIWRLGTDCSRYYFILPNFFPAVNGTGKKSMPPRFPILLHPKSRLSHNAIVQEGEAPAEDPGDLLAQLDRATARLEELMASINLANSRTVVNDKTLTQIIARKDCLRLRLEAYRELAETASQTARRATRSEIRILSTVDVKTIQAQVDTMAKELRLLDNELQQTNWTTEL